MGLQRRPRKSEAGYTMIEIALVMSIVAIVAILATPSFLTYYQASRLRVGAEEVAAFINQGRQLGIRENTSVCVHINSTALQYRLGTSCSLVAITSLAGDAWVGPGTDSNGAIHIPQGLTLSTNADPFFNYLGAASPGASIAVTNTQTGTVLHVTVAGSGRVSIGP